MINWNGYERKRVSTFVTNVYIFLRETAKKARNISESQPDVRVFSLRPTKPQGYTLFIKPNWNQFIFVKIKTCKFANKIYLKYTEAETRANAAAERDSVLFQPKTWEAKECDECSIMQVFHVLYSSLKISQHPYVYDMGQCDPRLEIFRL
jgi:hypothetical protein